MARSGFSSGAEVWEGRCWGRGKEGGGTDRQDEAQHAHLPSTSSSAVPSIHLPLLFFGKLISVLFALPQAKFKARSYEQSIFLYSASLTVASQRMPWEASGVFKEEMSTVLCNRSAAYGAMGDVRTSFTSKGASCREGEEERNSVKGWKAHLLLGCFVRSVLYSGLLATLMLML